jgi:hypothetical protein
MMRTGHGRSQFRSLGIGAAKKRRRRGMPKHESSGLTNPWEYGLFVIKESHL